MVADKDFGMHSSADAIIAGIVTPAASPQAILTNPPHHMILATMKTRGMTFERFLLVQEGQAMLAETRVFGDPLQLPSLSNFESFFILKALGALKASAQAGYLAHRHWAGMLRLG